MPISISVERRYWTQAELFTSNLDIASDIVLMVAVLTLVKGIAQGGCHRVGYGTRGKRRRGQTAIALLGLRCVVQRVGEFLSHG